MAGKRKSVEPLRINHDKNRTSGHFDLAGHNDPVMFRNIAVKTLE